MNFYLFDAQIVVTSPIYRARSIISELRRIFVTLNAPANAGFNTATLGYHFALALNIEHGESLVHCPGLFIFKLYILLSLGFCRKCGGGPAAPKRIQTTRLGSRCVFSYFSFVFFLSLTILTYILDIYEC
jgi:hypothetical protein